MPGLYVHVPFCVSKCDYCAFYSIPLQGKGITLSPRILTTSDFLIEGYLRALKKEITLRQGEVPDGVSSLFIGGGTPTVLPEAGLETLLQALHDGFCLPDEIEKSVEANPGTLSRGKLEILRAYGFNRISLGAQSFSDGILRKIGRIHRVRAIHDAVALIRTAGFRNLNLDLMFGLPGQSFSLWQESVEEALKFSPQHLSVYALSLEEGTPLAIRYGQGKDVQRQREPEQFNDLPSDDLQADMYDWAVERLERAGFVHYEVSNFALPGRMCRHNLDIWRGGDYIGLGPGAVSCLKGIRWKNIENVREYERRLDSGELIFAAEEREALTRRERMAERLILGLRLPEGVDMAAFKKEFGAEIRDIYPDVLERYEKQGILYFDNGYLRLHPRYIFIANSILANFI